MQFTGGLFDSGRRLGACRSRRPAARDPRAPLSRSARDRHFHTHGGCPRGGLLHSACILLASTTIRRIARPPHRPPPCLRGRRRPAPPLDRDGGRGLCDRVPAPPARNALPAKPLPATLRSVDEISH